jgi:superoxide dismutase, Fe-Mn family
MMDTITRRAATGLIGLGTATAALAAGQSDVRAQTAGGASVPAFAAKHEPKPLSFDAAKLLGLSEKLVTSHWQNNYIGSVKALNLIEIRLAAALADPDFPALVYGGLKREELHRTGSVILHEEYFASLGGDGKAGGQVGDAIKAAFGSFGAWQTEFKRTAMSLAGGSGWCVLVYNLNTKSIHNHWAWDHMHSAVSGLPLLPLDMYEHSYHMDYGTAAAKYVDAFLDNVNWEEVERRYIRAVKMAQA